MKIIISKTFIQVSFGLDTFRFYYVDYRFWLYILFYMLYRFRLYQIKLKNEALSRSHLTEDVTLTKRIDRRIL